MTWDDNAQERSMQHAQSKYWWIYATRGCLSVVFGIAALLIWPILEMGPMGSFFGVFIFIQGLLTLVPYLKMKKRPHRLPVFLESVLGISIGIFLFLMTDFSHALFIVSFISWGIGIGICKVIHAGFLYRNEKIFGVLGLNGLLSILFNLMIYVQAEVTQKPIAWILSIYFLVYGLLMITFGAKLKGKND